MKKPCRNCFPIAIYSFLSGALMFMVFFSQQPCPTHEIFQPINSSGQEIYHQIELKKYKLDDMDGKIFVMGYEIEG